jgi:2-methylcitrate dehydratase
MSLVRERPCDRFAGQGDRALIRPIERVHGGPEFDAKYPDGLPTSVEVDHAILGTLASGLVLDPLGHARNTSSDLAAVLDNEFDSFAALGVPDAREFHRHLSGVAHKPPTQVRRLYDFPPAGRDLFPVTAP